MIIQPIRFITGKKNESLGNIIIELFLNPTWINIS